ncbi:hypothetical protein ABCW43_28190 [Neorhizobium sp. IRAMC:178]|uniref:hypothetical protein n=1 Tax=Neorhizobium tunisiense TaxID=3144793 RepID=UPI0031F71BF5
MGLHKLEIEVDDEMLSRIDAAAARINRSRAEVVVEKLKDLPPTIDAQDRSAIERRLAFLREMSARIDALGRPGRSAEEIDRQIREFREDRKYDQ